MSAGAQSSHPLGADGRAEAQLRTLAWPSRSMIPLSALVSVSAFRWEGHTGLKTTWSLSPSRPLAYHLLFLAFSPSSSLPRALVFGLGLSPPYSTSPSPLVFAIGLGLVFALALALVILPAPLAPLLWPSLKA
ncbi:uncharacterized protein C8Q71DRAFT_880149 [Rhodofomes roseus]|uniref:Uncharacterized protein n=1 Tax=Rhodofomes roseus TaxID=34475 RepID=A0ABQ8K6B4_9APHY|nr:uncharacterized protein C8Q71DRAFT_880149 [Rhodofomes roseus]KAH9832261.1 hypothetical protein C8Q71DRAFT_880149 [Rhodofomes roseus]